MTEMSRIILNKTHGRSINIMTDVAIYRDIAERTQGDIYIGVVGPVRTGKSTLIKKFMETLVLPNIANQYGKERAKDELPQSANGKTVMTTEPKFIPDSAVEIDLGENTTFKVKMIDCVGYIVPGALGHYENEKPRMVMTPWSEKEMPFDVAAEIGTKKVINDHSTIGFLVTTDGTIGEIPRENYIEAEERVVKELKQINKPFVMILNSSVPEAEESIALAYELEEKYRVPVALVNCLDLTDEDIKNIIEMVLFEFPIKEVGITIPSWINALDENHWLYKSINQSIFDIAEKISKIGEVKNAFNDLNGNENILSSKINSMNLGEGTANLEIRLTEGLFYRILGDSTGFDIKDEQALIKLMSELAVVKKEYDKISGALKEVSELGYGIVTPDIDDLMLEEPEIVKQAGGYGVKLRASAPSIHMIRANIETEVSPIVGTEKQSEELVKFLLHEFEEDPKKIWESNMFGKSLHELVNEGLHTKLSHMPQDAREKLAETLERIINEGSGGLICIIL